MKLNLAICLLLFTSVMMAQDYSRDIKMGAKASKDVEKEMGDYHHDALEKIVRNVGEKLVAALKKKPEGFQFQFHLVEAEEPNAFALPGGYVYVTRGLLPLVQTEDELAGIMAHEIMHVIKRHSVRQFNRAVIPFVLELPGELVNAVSMTNLTKLINLPIVFVSETYLANYSRKHEKEADDLGIELAADAGYNPKELANALNRLSKGVEAMTGEMEKRNFLNDHPYTPKRVEDIVKRSAKLSIAKVPHLYSSQEAFIQNFKGLFVGNNPKNGVFIDSLFIQPDLNFSMIMPAGWKKVNEPDMVSATPADKGAAVTLCMADEKKTPRELGLEMQKKLTQSKTIHLEYSGDTTINSLPSYILRVTGKKNGKSGTLEMIWISYEQHVYQLSGISVPEKRKLCAESIRSFRPARSIDRSKIKAREIEIVSSQADETLEAFSKRTNNKLKPEITRIINDLGKDAKLPANKEIKIAVEKVYQN